MIIDISWNLKKGMPTYPKNPQFNSKSASTGHSTISTITMGTHTGTHIDAPLHCIEGARSVTDLDLTIFVGKCRVLDCTESREKVTKQDLEKHNIQEGERILIKTTNSDLPKDKFYPNYVYLGPSGATFLANSKVKLVGIDYLSVKQRGSKDNTPHTALLRQNIPILEGIDLAKVSASKYMLFALPLKLEGLDGSPTRAVLVPDTE